MNRIISGDSLEALKKLPNESADCIVTSPPYYGLRDYGVTGQLGLEPTFEEYIAKLMEIFDEAKRVIKKTGTCWVNLGDSYCATATGSKRGSNASAGLQEKSLLGIPFRFALAMIEHGWILRNTIIWHKPNAMPSSVKDRFSVDFEYVFFFTKNKLPTFIIVFLWYCWQCYLLFR